MTSSLHCSLDAKLWTRHRLPWTPPTVVLASPSFSLGDGACGYMLPVTQFDMLLLCRHRNQATPRVHVLHIPPLLRAVRVDCVRIGRCASSGMHARVAGIFCLHRICVALHDHGADTGIPAARHSRPAASVWRATQRSQPGEHVHVCWDWLGVHCTHSSCVHESDWNTVRTLHCLHISPSYLVC